MIVQDASAMETQGGSDQALVDDLVELSSRAGARSATYLCCVNRGVLASACRRVYQQDPTSRAFTTLKSIIDATAFKVGTAAGPRPSCWPMTDDRVACWPLDVSSLFDANGEIPSPAEHILIGATDQRKWETNGACADCDSRNLCPFRENARSLRDADTRQAFVRLVRRGELASGERLNFRSTLSLVAEAIVGDWPDFAGLRDPCEWIHEHVEELSRTPLREEWAIHSSLRLLSRLTPHAMFRERGPNAVEEELERNARDAGRHSTEWLLSHAARVFSSGNSSLRHATLPRVLSPLTRPGTPQRSPRRTCA